MVDYYIAITLSYFLNINMNKIHVLQRKYLHFIVEICKNLEYIYVYTE